MDRPPRLPDFIIIGVAKCGTTDLASLLGKHPRIGMSDPKEPGFFNRDELDQRPEVIVDPWAGVWRAFDWDAHLDANLHGYSYIFGDAPAGVLLGEATTSYAHSRRAPGRIRELIPHAKLIVMLREPAKRLVSHYWYDVQHCRTCVTPHSHLHTKQSADLLRRGLYAEQLKQWLSIFPRDQLHVVLFEEYVSPRTRQQELDKVCRFLGIEPSLDAAKTETFTNKTGVPRWLALELALNMLRLRFDLPGTTAYYKNRKPRGWKRRLINLFVQGLSRINISYDRKPPAWPPEWMERLRTYYRYENAELSELIGRDVDAIWYGTEEQPAAILDRPLAVQ